MWMGEPNRSRRQVAGSASGIDAMDRRNEGRNDPDSNDGCEDCQGHMRAPLAAPVEIVVHGQHLQSGLNAAALSRFRPRCRGRHNGFRKLMICPSALGFGGLAMRAL
jgi:hypothetical protein